MPVNQILADYDHWLQRQALAARTRASYRRWVRELVAHLDAGDELRAFLARDGAHDRRAVLGDWRRRLVDRGLAPSTVNLALAAATSLLDSRALPPPRVPGSSSTQRRHARSRRTSYGLWSVRPIAWARAATGRSWSCCFAPACGSASSPTSTPATYV